MNDYSRYLARQYPLRVRDIARVGDAVLVARANWDILEVRDLSGTLVMRHEVVPGVDDLIHSARFAGGRFLVVELGGGIMAGGYRAWDAYEKEWSAPVMGYWDERCIAGLDATRVVLSNGTNLHIREIASGRVLTELPVRSPACAALHPADPDAVAIVGDSGSFANLGEDGGAIALLHGSERKAVLRIDFGVDDLVAWVGSDRVAWVSDAGDVRLLDRELKSITYVGKASGLPADLSVHESSLTVRTEASTWFFDHASGKQCCVPGSARIDPMTETIVWATDHAAGTLDL